jgi:LPS-assembly protein
LSYSEDRSRNDGDTTNRLLFFRVGLRTLGNTQIQSNAINN